MHMISKTDLCSDELDTLTPLWCLEDLNLFVTVQLLEETPAVLSLGKLCEDHGLGQRSKNTVDK